MYRYLLTLVLACLMSYPAFAQDTLLIEDFEDTVNVFSLNVNGTLSGAGVNGYNGWIVNNTYLGGSETLIDCFFMLPLPYNVGDTDTQPAGVTGAPQSNYMHIVSDTALADGIGNANFLAADGLCYTSQNNVSLMDTAINTFGYDSVEVSFYWICGQGSAPGGILTAFGEAYYSIDGGANWILIAGGSTFSGQTTWTQSTFSLPDFANQTDLRIGFRFVNGIITLAEEPGFGIDQLQITAFSAASFTADTVSQNRFCADVGGSATIQITANGIFGGSSVFTAELSDDTGSFANPLNIGATPGQTSILVTIPGGLTPGNNYRIRVASSQIGTFDTLNTPIILDPPPIRGQVVFTPDPVCVGNDVQITSFNGLGETQWDVIRGTDSISAIAPAIQINDVILPTRVTLITRSGVCPVDTSKAVNVPIETVESNFSFANGPNPGEVIFSDASTNPNTWFWTFANFGNSNQPSPIVTFAANGSYEVCLEVTSAAGCKDTTCQDVAVETITSLESPENVFQVSLLPNPANDYLWIQASGDFQGPALDIQIFDLQGKAWTTQENRSLPYQIDIRSLPDGLYLMRISDGTRTTSLKWVKQP